jgi:hypothetical protein
MTGLKENDDRGRAGKVFGWPGLLAYIATGFLYKKYGKCNKAILGLDHEDARSLVILFFTVLPVWLSGCSEMTGNTRTAKAQ